MRIYRCDGETDGILTAVSRAIDDGISPLEAKIECVSDSEQVNYELFSEYVEIKTDPEIAASFVEKMYSVSPEMAESVLFACLHTAPDRADKCFRFIKKIIFNGPKAINKLQDPDIRRIFELRRFAANEVHHFKGFLRFSETPEHILLAGYEPRADITSILLEHFRDRFPCEKIVIVDLVRNKAGFYAPGKPCFMSEAGEKLLAAAAACAGDKSDFASLWREYVDNIAIVERLNPALQQNNMRLRFRGNMTEFGGRNK